MKHVIVSKSTQTYAIEILLRFFEIKLYRFLPHSRVQLDHSNVIVVRRMSIVGMRNHVRHPEILRSGSIVVSHQILIAEPHNVRSNAGTAIDI